MLPLSDLNISKDWSTHMPVLISLMRNTSGDVLEIGTGIYSTPFLHWACFIEGRNLVSIENNYEYIEFVRQFEWRGHKVEEKIPVMGEWDIVFIDSSPNEDRVALSRKFSETAKYVIVHDSDREDFPGFKFRFDYENVYPATTVLSNIIDLSKFKI